MKKFLQLVLPTLLALLGVTGHAALSEEHPTQRQMIRAESLGPGEAAAAVRGMPTRTALAGAVMVAQASSGGTSSGSSAGYSGSGTGGGTSGGSGTYIDPPPVRR